MSFGFGLSLPAYPLRGGGGNNPFNQDGATLDLSFVGTAGDLSGADTYTLNTDFITPEYQVAAQYAVWENGVGLAQKTFSQIVTFTRASTATYFNSAGTLTSAAINEARFDYNPSTLLARGFLIEEQRTNSIRNNTMQGAVAGTPGTFPTNWTLSTTGAATTQVVGTGTENGITYIDLRFQGTGAADSWNLIYDSSVVAANGQSWTSSVYLKLVAGAITNLPLIQRIVFRNSSFANIQALDSSAITPTNAGLATQRSTLSLTATQATTAFVTNQLNSGTPTGAYDITLRIGLPQLEQGAFATSVIPTTTTALTRSADVASVNTLSPWFNSTAGTIFAEFLRNTTPAASTFPQFVNIDDGSINNRLALSTNSSRNLRGQVAIAGVFTTIATANAYTEGAVSKLALGYQALNHAAVANGGTAATDTSVNVPSGLTTMRLGDQSGGAGNANGWLRRITYYPRRLSNAELQAITT